jgi:hypothetical protein
MGLDQIRQLLQVFARSFLNLLPVIGVVALFQWLVMREWPEGAWAVLAGLVLVAVGIALFLRGLALSVFPLGRNIADAFVQRGMLVWLLIFGFCLGAATVIAEPALIAVAHKAEMVSEGRVGAWPLRLLVAASVGAVIALGLLRAVLNHPVLWYVLAGYLLLIPVTYLTPAEITGLAFDAGAVSVNMVTVPLITALGMGLMAALRGRSVLSEGFGLAALAVMAPRLTVQLYGIVVYAAEPGSLAAYASGAGLELVQAPSAALRDIATDVLAILANLVPVVAVILLFQFAVIRRALLHPRRLAGGFALLLLGLFAFIEGLHTGLFPIGEYLASGLSRPAGGFYLLVFVFLLGFAVTLLEPALMAVIRQAAHLDPGRLRPPLIRTLVALGVGLGLLLGALRLMSGWPLDHVIAGTLAVLAVLAVLAPRDLVGFAFDLGGIATSDVTVPVITALGVGLAVALGSDDVMLEGFGLVALASLCVIVTVLLYAIVVQRMNSHGETP